jgi:hypothetical protein
MQIKYMLVFIVPEPEVLLGRENVLHLFQQLEEHL